jgi:hypothetical protein
VPSVFSSGAIQDKVACPTPPSSEALAAELFCDDVDCGEDAPPPPHPARTALTAISARQHLRALKRGSCCMSSPY